jgi:hypothetical protein
VLAVNGGEEKSVVSSFVTRMNLSLPVILDLDKTIFNQYNVVVLPVTVWVDPQGVVRAEQIGPLDSKMVANYVDLLSRSP